MHRMLSKSAEPSVTVCLLGNSGVVAHDEPLKLGARSAFAVVAFVTLSRNRRAPRAQIIEALWPEANAQQGRNNLRQALHRIKQGYPDSILILDGEEVSLNTSCVQVDLDQADDLYREYSFAPHLPDSIQVLERQWQLMSQPFMPGWEEDWVEEHRISFKIRAHEIGILLSKALENANRADEALQVLESLALGDIIDFEALESAVRLLARSKSAAEALNWFNERTAILVTDNITPSLKSLVNKIRDSKVEYLTTGELFQTRNELVLLSRIVESNLKSGGKEVMELLAKESGNLDNWTHPSTLLSLLTVALDQCDVQSDAEIEVAINATFLATYASDPKVGLWAGQRVLDALPDTDPRAMTTRSVMGFIHFETTNYDVGRTFLTKAYQDSLHENGKIVRPRILNRLGVLEYHLGNFDTAKEIFLEAIRQEIANDTPRKNQLLASFYGNLCTMEILRECWEESQVFGEKTLEHAVHDGKVYSIYVQAALGLSKLMLGQPDGILEICQGIRQTSREQMRRFNLMANDFGAYALAKKKHSSVDDMLSANTMVREALGYPRSPAEQRFAESIGNTRGVSTLPVSLVSASRWVVQELESI